MKPSRSNFEKFPFLRVYFIGISGSAMSNIAAFLACKGVVVGGSDTNFYPPSGDILKKHAIKLYKGYSEENIKDFNPDAVIIGNVVRRDNEEAIFVMNNGISYFSFPSFLERFVLNSTKNIVVTGTHGKTTTTSLITWILKKAGLSPSFLIGGIPLGFDTGFYIGKGDYFVIEGDEYDTAFFDKVPKFLHYKPEIGVITNIEHDHIDIYPEFSDVLNAFSNFVKIVPDGGSIVAFEEDESVRKVLEFKKPSVSVITYGDGGNQNLSCESVRFSDAKTEFVIRDGNKKVEVQTVLAGKHNVLNILAAYGVSKVIGIKDELFLEGVKSFKGVKKRLEVKGKFNGALIIEDFGHHPSEIKHTLMGLRERYKNKKIVTVFRPESNTSRTSFFQNRYVESFLLTDVLVLGKTIKKRAFIEAEAFDPFYVLKKVKKGGVSAFFFENREGVVEFLKSFLNKDHVVVIFSPRGFDDLYKDLVQENLK